MEWSEKDEAKESILVFICNPYVSDGGHFTCKNKGSL